MDVILILQGGGSLGGMNMPLHGLSACWQKRSAWPVAAQRAMRSSWSLKDAECLASEIWPRQHLNCSIGSWRPSRKQRH
jgi:hypothetical protein